MSGLCAERPVGRPVEPRAIDPRSVPVHEATALTVGGSTAHIRLGGQVYVLRITRQGKLILTK